MTVIACVSYSFLPSKQLDRFIPNRSAMDFDFAHYMLIEGRKAKERPPASSLAAEAYRKWLAEVFNMNRTRILAFKNKTLAPVELIPREFSSSLYSLQLYRDCAWKCSLSVEYFNGSTSELVSIDEEDGPVTSVCWAPDGQHIAIGLNNSEVQLWDSTANQLLRTLRGGHRMRVGTLAWNDHILTIGGMDSLIINNDVRVRAHIVETYRGHSQEVCGIKWSASGQQFASGGSDNLLHIWDRSRATSNSVTRWLQRLEDHTSAVKALARYPFQSNLLAFGGGEGDRCIKFWNTHTTACLSSINTGSLVSALLWSKNERELLSSHGLPQNELVQ
ncbi:hypothetical protein FH972_005105 [Carpinus fangiana]|uniref:CDC20/Fizzy WD40 domain-containing protein n=1 Tax=Carpinus fangiana TaxID=176857 RepID=A0A5N6QQN1_9ROSI|nr:hypothetical protein FH972_005105 [Carpinus fangiana]